MSTQAPQLLKDEIKSVSTSIAPTVNAPLALAGEKLQACSPLLPAGTITGIPVLIKASTAPFKIAFFFIINGITTTDGLLVIFELLKIRFSALITADNLALPFFFVILTSNKLAFFATP
ncbi:hypothetical protein WICMUC_002733 [Wickerhamomyces mucosus]|uniref:Uncharacterized protein n=1 Tax=Wickerhamomyces mucosus TaxID=1378264 RepID=A0A9P8PQ15_9ASCO|nr:hypothetical protein WICMUC_002733 [Wickerhamomyces mucosus]